LVDCVTDAYVCVEDKCCCVTLAAILNMCKALCRNFNTRHCSRRFNFNNLANVDCEMSFDILLAWLGKAAGYLKKLDLSYFWVSIQIRQQSLNLNNTVENFVNIFSTRATLLLFSKFSAPTIAFLAFWLAKKLRPCWIWSDYNQLALRARWLFYHFISNSGSWNNCYFIVTYVSALWFTKFSYRELWKSMIFLQRQSFSS